MPRRSPRVEVSCRQCGTMMLVTPYQLARGGGQYCGRVCHTKSQTKRVECTCEYCASTFIAKAFRVAQGDGRFCSMACVRARDRDLATASGPSNWSDVELAYLAGIIDGEGSFSIVKRHESRARGTD